MPRYLLQLAQVHDQFRIPELESLARLYNIKLSIDTNGYADDASISIPNGSRIKVINCPFRVLFSL
jgi:tRNA G10  N-methylase Trm11